MLKIQMIYQHHEEAEKGYQWPEYFFRVNIAGVIADSGLLGFKDWIEIKLKNQSGIPIPDEDYVLTLPDGSQIKGKVDELGNAIEKDIPPGVCKIDFPNL